MTMVPLPAQEILNTSDTLQIFLWGAVALVAGVFLGFRLTNARNRNAVQRLEDSLSNSRKKIATGEYRSEVQDLVTRLSSRFVHMSIDEVGKGIEQALAEVGAFTGVDRAYVYLYSEDGLSLNCSHSWVDAGLPEDPPLGDLMVNAVPWWHERIQEGVPVHVPMIGKMPPEASGERQVFEERSVQSLILVPMIMREVCIGCVGFDSVRKVKYWPDELVPVLRSFGEMFCNALDDQKDQKALKQSQSRLQKVVSSSSVALFTLGPNGEFLVGEEQNLTPLKLENADPEGKTALEFFADSNKMVQALKSALEGEEIEAEIHLGQRVFQVHFHPEFGVGNRLDKVVGIANDITERWLAKLQLRIEKRFDRLTGLPNQDHFLDKIEQRIPAIRDSKETTGVLVHLNLDRFRGLNESLGNRSGDILLKSVARMMQDSFGSNTAASRTGGDGFAVFVERVRDPDQVAELCSALQESLNLGIDIPEHGQVPVSASIGIAPWSPAYRHGAEWLRDATTAMKDAKGAGGSRQSLFASTMHRRAVAAWKMEGDLRRAVEEDELIPHYQAIVDLKTGTPVGFEALLRWTHPELGPVSPGEFIPVAETTGLIIPIGASVLRKACTDLASWLKVDSGHPWVSVNAAAAQLGEEGFPSTVREILAETGLAPESLKLEITETALIQQAEKAGQTLQEVREEGVKLSLDDFGTGYSSLSYLHKFPVDTIKIDRSFVQAMNGSPEGREIPRSIILLANSLDMDVVAEGVETNEQAEALREMGCRQGQGFLWSKPIPAAEVPALLGT